MIRFYCTEKRGEGNMTRKALWSDSATSQGMPAATRTCRRQGRLFPEPLEGDWIQGLDLDAQ